MHMVSKAIQFYRQRYALLMAYSTLPASLWQAAF
jgi:hypothetical protein